VPAQFAFVVQPATHVWFAVQMGRAVPQSLFARHATQVAVVVSHTAPPAAPMQSVLAAHSTHCWVVGSQTAPLALCAQSVAVTQPTQAPVAVSQIGVRPPAAQLAPPSTSHAAWQV
jgi:hypothetical protein